jgi:hypothetical protein
MKLANELLPVLGIRLLTTVLSIHAGKVKVKVKFPQEQATKA